jgi:hypothetical protein
MQWRVPTTVPTVKLVLAALFVVVTITLSGDLISAVVGLAVAIGLGVSGLRDLLAPVRLEADHEALAVTTLTGRRSYPWSAVQRVRIDDRRRLLGRSVMLEVDVDTNLYFLGRLDLGVPPIEVLDALTELRTGR